MLYAGTTDPTIPKPRLPECARERSRNAHPEAVELGRRVLVALQRRAQHMTGVAKACRVLATGKVHLLSAQLLSQLQARPHQPLVLRALAGHGAHTRLAIKAS